MGGLPTKSQLEKRNKDANEKLRRFKKLHDDFISMWQEAMKEEKGLLQAYSRNVDKSKITSIINTIEKL